MLKIAICDDNLQQQEEVELLIQGMGLKESVVIKKFSSGEDLLKAYKDDQRFSVILLDMQMKELDGIQTAEYIRKYKGNCLIIIITSIIEYAVKGYSIDAYDFIMKPVGKKKFVKVLSKAINEIQVRENKVYTIKRRDMTVALRLSRIIYIESDKKRVIVHTKEKSYTNNENISIMEKKLQNDGFIRISRYFLVNINHITEIGVKSLELSTGEQLNYSEKFRDPIKEEYMKFIMGDM